jgi:hypothetical protein
MQMYEKEEKKKNKDKEKDDDFIFPFSTCETPKKDGIAQPYSVLANMLSIFVILYFLFQTKHIYPFLLLLSFLAFECVHAFSHTIHLPGYVQNNITHCIAYTINVFYLLTFYHYTKHAPNITFLIFLVCLTIFDVYSLMFLSFVYYFSSSMIIFFSILIYYYPYIPKNKQSYIVTILLLGFLIIGLFYNEKYNCKSMLRMFPGFPFHALLELNGTVIFYYLCKFFYQM